MTKIKFPTESFIKEKRYAPETFSVEAVLLISLNKFFTVFLISQIFELNCAMKKSYKYYLSEFETSFLGKVDDKDKDFYFADTKYSLVYNFCHSFSKRRYKGIIEIKVEFIDKDSLENSYFKVAMCILPEVDINIEFSNITEEGILKISQDFLEKIWESIFKSLKKKELNNFNSINKTDLKDYLLTCAISPQIDISKEIFVLLKDESFTLNDSITDLFHIIMDKFICDKTNPKAIFLSCEEVLSIKNKKKNINTQGNRGGFKEKQKDKIKKDLMFLKAANIINYIEIEKNQFRITLIHNAFKSNSIIYPISKKIAEYNPRSNFYCKRIGEYLSFHSYTLNQKNLEINTIKLINLGADNFSSLKPSLLRENLEKALDTLSKDEIISRWEYKKINEDELKGSNWFKKYKTLKIKINMQSGF